MRSRKEVRSLLGQLSFDRKGNVAIIFAASIIPIVVAVGASVDYGNALNARTKMQAALDSAVIAGAKAYANSGNTGTAQSAADNQYQKAAGGNPAPGAITQFTIDAGQVRATANATSTRPS